MTVLGFLDGFFVMTLTTPPIAIEPYTAEAGPLMTSIFSMPARNVIPKSLQKPHPPIWLACSNKETIHVAARNGVDAFKEWWNTDEGKAARHVAKPNLSKLQAIATEADKAMQDDPFGLPPMTPTQAEIDAQMEAAAAAVRAAHEAEAAGA